MNHPHGEHPDRQLLFLQALVEEHATISGDIIEVGTHAWAIHGDCGRPFGSNAERATGFEPSNRDCRKRRICGEERK